MIRDMMVQCVEQRFGDIRAPRKVQWLSDNGSIFAAPIELLRLLSLLTLSVSLRRRPPCVV